MKGKTSAKRVANKWSRRKKRPTIGDRIIEGLEQAIAWTRGENDRARVTLVHVPYVRARGVQQEMGF